MIDLHERLSLAAFFNTIGRKAGIEDFKTPHSRIEAFAEPSCRLGARSWVSSATKMKPFRELIGLRLSVIAVGACTDIATN